MNFQEKLFETTADLRARAAALANVAVSTARARAQVAAKRVDVLKGSFDALTVAGREFNKVARRHAVRFVKENSTIAADAGKDVSALARTHLSRRSPNAAAATPKTRKASSVPQARDPQGRLTFPLRVPLTRQCAPHGAQLRILATTTRRVLIPVSAIIF